MPTTKKTRRSRILAGVAISCLGGLALILAATQQADQAKGAVPSGAIRVAGGGLGPGRSWSVLLFGSRKLGSCWVTRSEEHGLVSDSTSCGYSVPMRAWQLAAKGAARNGKMSMLFFLTRRNVGKLRVAVFNGRRARYFDFQAGRLTKTQARRADLPTNFGFAGHSFSGRLECIRAIEVFDRSGTLIKRARRPGC